MTYDSIGNVPPDTIVELLEFSDDGKWGRVESGWVCMDSVFLRNLFAVISLKIYNKDDIYMLPKGEKLYKILDYNSYYIVCKT